MLRRRPLGVRTLREQSQPGTQNEQTDHDDPRGRLLCRLRLARRPVHPVTGPIVLTRTPCHLYTPETICTTDGPPQSQSVAVPCRARYQIGRDCPITDTTPVKIACHQPCSSLLLSESAPTLRGWGWT